MIRVAGASGTTFRLMGGSLIEGEGAPFDKMVYNYSIVDGIRDGYLVPAFSVGADDVIDVSKLRTRLGEFTNDSQDAQMIAMMDNHISQMVHVGANRRAWLVFEASVKAAHAMRDRMEQWGIPTGIVLGETPAAERAATIAAFRAGRLRALVNRDALTTGFDVQQVDMLVMRRATKSLGLYVQMIGRLLRTIGGNIQASIAAGKSDGLVLDFSGNISRHGPLDFLVMKPTKSNLVSCSECGKRNASAAARCWSCDAVMTKLCPACLVEIRKGELDCPHCQHDMRVERSEPTAPKLFELPSGAALISSYSKNQDRTGGWAAVKKCFSEDGTVTVDTDSQRVTLPESLSPFAEKIKWIRVEPLAVLIPNGASRTSALQINSDGASVVVPMPAVSP
jgi:DNA repair protein RadD